MIIYNKDKTELHSLTMKLMHYINKGDINYEDIANFMYLGYNIGLKSEKNSN